MKSALTSSVKSIFLPLGLTAGASATHAAIQKKDKKIMDQDPQQFQMKKWKI